MVQKRKETGCFHSTHEDLEVSLGAESEPLGVVPAGYLTIRLHSLWAGRKPSGRSPLHPVFSKVWVLGAEGMSLLVMKHRLDTVTSDRKEGIGVESNKLCFHETGYVAVSVGITLPHITHSLRYLLLCFLSSVSYFGLFFNISYCDS